jgi:hypothetical protein
MLPSEEWRAAQALTAAPKFNSGMTVRNKISKNWLKHEF